MFLQYFCRGKKLHTPLGPWVATPPYQWRWYQDSGRVVWEQDHRADQWFRYTFVESSRRQTRQTSHQYRDRTPSAPPLSISDLFPAMVMKAEHESITIVSSATKFPTPHVPLPPNLWQHAEVPDALAGTPQFFQHLISTPLTETQCSDIANEISEESLVMCSDGAHDASRQVASHGLVFGSSLLRQTITTATGPVDGHPTLVTSYRAELGGIVATLYLVYRICQFYSIMAGAAKSYCDNKGALNNAFSPIKKGITPYFNTNHDLVEVAQSLLQLLPIAISNEWVKGHYEGKNKQYQHHLNEEADEIAGTYQLHQRPHRTVRKPLSPPGLRIRLLYESSIITSRVQSALQNSLHGSPIEEQILKKTKWTRWVSIWFTGMHTSERFGASPAAANIAQQNLSTNWLLPTDKTICTMDIPRCAPLAVKKRKLSSMFLHANIHMQLLIGS
jgi:hypothetical protein